MIDARAKHGRRVFVIGRSMVDNVNMALEQGYLELPARRDQGVERCAICRRSRVAIVTTGSQGEPTSALARMANRDHRWVQIVPGDTVVLSASPIPGNEQYVYNMVDNLFKLGAHVLYNRVGEHPRARPRGPGRAEARPGLVRPQYFVPSTASTGIWTLHARLAQRWASAGEPFVLEDGDVLEIGRRDGEIVEHSPAAPVYVDGLGVGDVDDVVLRDRQHLANDGMVVIIVSVDKQTGKVVGKPEVMSRGVTNRGGRAANRAHPGHGDESAGRRRPHRRMVGGKSDRARGRRQIPLRRDASSTDGHAGGSRGLRLSTACASTLVEPMLPLAPSALTPPSDNSTRVEGWESTGLTPTPLHAWRGGASVSG